MTKPPTTTEKALKLRAQVKKRKPKFVRQESWRYKRLKENWRRPKGLDNKMRRKIKGWPPTVNVGYRGPKVARGLHPSGYKEVLVHNAEEIKKVDPKTQAVRIAHTVGKRERAKILTESRKRRITVLNIKEVVKEEKLEKEEETEEKEKPKQKRKRKEKPKGRAEEQ
ncbi:MAG: 50S ribosomal protein L32e [Candidatus Bathyarchaeota archaeon]|nr:50S ribosomal protein L32e [Candidatus Bathyarchaeota archaeon]MDI6805656.1 50S ribosomal protein L32e [Candidatus Bathyarchaeia archaeon]